MALVHVGLHDGPDRTWQKFAIAIINPSVHGRPPIYRIDTPGDLIRIAIGIDRESRTIDQRQLVRFLNKSGHIEGYGPFLVQHSGICAEYESRRLDRNDVEAGRIAPGYRNVTPYARCDRRIHSVRSIVES